MRRLVVAFIFAILALPALSTPALGHERRIVGQYTFVVGWLNEPPLASQLNAIDLTITEASGDKRVAGLEQTLKAEIFYGGLTTPLAGGFFRGAKEPRPPPPPPLPPQGRALNPPTFFHGVA